MEYQGVMISGDFSAVAGQDVEMTISIKDDGKGSMAMQGESVDFTWTKKDDATITIKPATEDGESIDVTLKDGALFMTAPMDEVQAEAIFTPDGTYANAKEIDMSKATAVKSADELVGTWTACGLSMMGMSVYGDAASLTSIAGGTDMTATFTKDGKVTVMGGEGTYTVDGNGAVATIEGAEVPIKVLDGNIALDLSGATGMDMVFVLSK